MYLRVSSSGLWRKLRHTELISYTRYTYTSSWVMLQEFGIHWRTTSLLIPQESFVHSLALSICWTERQRTLKKDKKAYFSLALSRRGKEKLNYLLFSTNYRVFKIYTEEIYYIRENSKEKIEPTKTVYFNATFFRRTKMVTSVLSYTRCLKIIST
jgi:hypothetical protein